MRTNERTYERTHPWITFNVDLTRADAMTWLGLGEIQSKSLHLAGVPMKPNDAEKLHLVYLAKGLMATTAIEGNTLSAEEVERRIKGDLKLPPSKEYLGREIDNVLNAANRVMRDVLAPDGGSVSFDEICRCNREVLQGLEVDDDVIPGEVREHSVTVGRYKGAPAEDCDFLLRKLCVWLSGPTFQASPELEIVYGVIKAILAHLYIAWIHPFGDGNGRTARLIEVRLLLESGAPTSAAHLLSNHYNQTRSEYYRRLDEASRNGGDVLPFIKYAVGGLCEQLREQLKTVRSYHFRSTWQNYVHEQFHGLKTDGDHRRRHLVLALSERPKGVAITEVRRLTPEAAEQYSGKTQKTVVRDINALVGMGLLKREARLIKPNFEAISAFLPERRGPLPDGLLPVAA